MNLISPQIVSDSLRYVRFQIYVVFKLESEKRNLTYSGLMKKHGKFLDDVKRKLESRHNIFKMAIAK